MGNGFIAIVQCTMTWRVPWHEIELQQELGDEGLLSEDKFLSEVNLEDMETTSGERQEYWLLATKAARKATLLRYQRGDTTIQSAAYSDGDGCLSCLWLQSNLVPPITFVHNHSFHDRRPPGSDLAPNL